jgi:hypothetical protein
VAPSERTAARLALSLRLLPSRSPRSCQEVRGPERVNLRRGQSIGIEAGAALFYDLAPANGVPGGVRLSKTRPVFSARLVANRPLQISVAPWMGSKPYLCVSG